MAFRLTPKGQSYLLIAAAYDDLPRLTEAIARTRAAGTTTLSVRQATAEEHVTVAGYVQRTRQDLNCSRLLINKSNEMAGTGRDRLQKVATSAFDDVQKFVAITDVEFMRIDVLRYDLTDFFKVATTAIDAQFRLIDAVHSEIESTLRERVSSQRRQMTALLGLIGVLLLIGATAMHWMARSITRPLNAAIADANAIASGHLDTPITNVGYDEVEQVRRSIVDMQPNLAGIEATIRKNSDAVANAAREIASNTQDMSARAKIQASSLKQLNSTLSR